MTFGRAEGRGDLVGEGGAQGRVEGAALDHRGGEGGEPGPADGGVGAKRGSASHIVIVSAKLSDLLLAGDDELPAVAGHELLIVRAGTPKPDV
jgi:hypothetical protein